MSSRKESKKRQISDGVLQMKAEIEAKLLQDCKIDACVSKFVAQIYQRLGEEDFDMRCPILNSDGVPQEPEESKFEESLQGLKNELKEDLEHLVPGYVNSDSKEWMSQELITKIRHCCAKTARSHGSLLEERDEARENLLVAAAEQHWARWKAAGEADSLQKRATEEAFRQLGLSIAGTYSAADFACGGSIPIQEGTSPDNHKLLEQLVNDCLPATFGKGQEDVLDPAYRSAGKLDEGQFATSFNPERFGILRQIEQILLPSVKSDETSHPAFRQVVPELYKLNIYSGPSGIFKKHVDTPRAETQFGSLVVCLPSEFEGGNLLVQHGERVMDYNWSVNSASSIQWAAFYSDCEHEIKTVSKGHRITLTYNLHALESLGLALSRSPVVQPSDFPMYRELKACLAEPAFLRTGGVVGIFCAHAYPHAAEDASRLLPRILKGSDLVAHSVLSALGCQLEVRPVLRFDRQYYTAGEKLPRSTMKYLEVCEEQGREPDVSFIDTYQDRLEAWHDLEKRWKIIFMRRSVEDPEGYYSGRDSDDENIEESSYEDTFENLIESTDTENWKPKGACIGRALHPLKAVRTYIEESEHWDWILKNDWESDWLPDITWLTEPKNPQMALTYGVYGNEPSTGTSYSCAAIIAVIPPWKERMETLREL